MRYGAGMLQAPPRDRASKKKLLVGAQRHYPGDTLFDRIARAACRAQCIPRKELYESWEVAKRVRRRLRGPRILDLACGHGLLAHMLALLDPKTEHVLAVDRELPDSAARLAAALQETWPELATRVTHQAGDLDRVDVRPDDVVVSAHACGKLTDRILARAMDAGASVAVLPCCHNHGSLDRGGLDGWLPPDMAIDVVRAVQLRDRGYRVWTQNIPGDITPKNRLLLGRPDHAAARRPGTR